MKTRSFVAVAGLALWMSLSHADEGQKRPQGTPPAAAAPAQHPPANAGAPIQGVARFLVISDRESPLSAVVPGRIAHVGVGLGDNVRAGQVVASLDCSDLQAKRAAARAEHAAAQLKYEAKAKLQGLQSAAELEVELAAADVNRARSQIQIIDAQLAQCRFVAPFSGKVARVYVKVGQGVAAGAPVVDLVANGHLKARMNVPSAWLRWLKVGTPLTAAVSETGQKYLIKVTRISARVDAVSQTVEIEAQFDDKAQGLIAGMSGQATPS